MPGNGDGVDRGRLHVFGVAAVDFVAQKCVLAAEIVVAGGALGAGAAGQSRSQEDALADLKVSDAITNLCDFAGDVATGNVWQGDFDAGDTLANPEIQVIERTGTDADQDFF